MINHPTTFVIGAGASFDYGFPLGEALTAQIADALNMNGGNDSPARELMRSAIALHSRRPGGPPSNELFIQAHGLRKALITASSIDAFLESRSDNPNFELLGKMAIAACLITAEHKCEDLREHRRGEGIDLRRSEKSWLGRLFKHVMAPGVTRSAVERIFEHASFVVFNYDRCIEHYLEYALASHFSLDLPAAAKLVRDHLRIVHPYGSLGDLHEDAAVPFGQRYNPDTHAAGTGILEMSQRLLTFTESQKAKGADARTMLQSSIRVVFLGFGFGEQNVELLTTPDSIVQEIRATALCFSGSNTSETYRRIEAMLGQPAGPVQLRNCDCAALISDEQMFLTRR